MQSDELSEPERALWEAFPRGEPVDLSGGDLDFDSTNAWGPERTVRAEVISALLLGAQENEPGHVAAVRLTGARITGTLNLGGAHRRSPVAGGKPCVRRRLAGQLPHHRHPQPDRRSSVPPER